MNGILDSSVLDNVVKQSFKIKIFQRTYYTISLAKIFLIIFIRILNEHFYTRKYSESLHLPSEFFIHVNSEIF